ncbi:MAG: aspartate dehydrogenase [Candidatus Omnitrophica bacterium]|nr:aspartate dehydrogenase [Candidatus Omnitrophota bacterium]
MVGIVGCGAIGSSLAHALEKPDFSKMFRIAGLCDLEPAHARRLAKQLKKNAPILPLSELIQRSHIVIEATSVSAAPAIVQRALQKGRTVVALSVGAILPFAQKLRRWVRNGRLQIPSGAIGGLDAVKAARHGGLRRVTLTTRKPPLSLKGAPLLKTKRFNLDRLKRPVTLFRGNAAQAIRAFPQNINVAATLSMAGLGAHKTRVRIIADPAIRRNIHEIEATGAFGRLNFRMENLPSKQNPKTSVLAVFSALTTLEQLAQNWHIGT